MRREALLGSGLLLAAIGEIQWSTVFFASAQTQIEAVCLFAAAAGLLLAAAGLFFPGAARGVLFLGLTVAALGHFAYFGLTIGFGLLLSVAAILAAVGLGLAAGAARLARPDLLRIGFAGATLAGIIWTGADLTAATYGFMIGNVFTTVGFATAALFATSETMKAA